MQRRRLLKVTLGPVEREELWDGYRRICYGHFSDGYVRSGVWSWVRGTDPDNTYHEVVRYLKQWETRGEVL